MIRVFIFEIFHRDTGVFTVSSLVFNNRQSAEDYQRECLEIYHRQCIRTGKPWVPDDYQFSIIEGTLID